MTAIGDGAEFLAREMDSVIGGGFDLTYSTTAADGAVGAAYVGREGARLIFTAYNDSGDAVAEYAATIERRTVELICHSCGTVVGRVHPPAPPVPVACTACRPRSRA